MIELICKRVLLSAVLFGLAGCVTTQGTPESNLGHVGEKTFCVDDMADIGDFRYVKVNDKLLAAEITKLEGRSGFFSLVACYDKNVPIKAQGDFFDAPRVTFLTKSSAWSEAALSDTLKNSGYQFLYLNSVVDAGMRVVPYPSLAHTDLKKISLSARNLSIRQFNNISSSTQPEPIRLDGLEAYQFSVTGVPKGVAMELTYLYTHVKTPLSLIAMESWVLPVNFDKTRSLLTNLIWNLKVGGTELASYRENSADKPKSDFKKTMTPIRVPAQVQAEIKTDLSDNRPRWSGGQLMTPDPAEAASMAKVPIQPDVKPLTELEHLREEAEFAKRYQAELKAELVAAQQAQIKPVPVATSTKAGNRVALVIGNAAYKSSPLANPVNDATDMAKSLRALGFDVVERTNITIKQIGRTLRAFRTKIKPGDVALVFYAGHGLQINGENYLPAVDADIVGEDDVPNQSLSTRQIMDVLADSKSSMNLVFLDACRDNPYARSFRSSTRGLSRENAPSGTLLSYATRPGSVAADGTGRNGLYTSVLLKAMEEKDQPIELLLKQVVSGVFQASNGSQEPWMEGSIRGNFCFGGCR